MNYTKDIIREAFKDYKSKPIGKHRFFSVLIPIIEDNGELCFLFETRASHMESQPGEICFPGGTMEHGETPVESAIRETYEEIGILEENIEILSRGNTLYGYANYTLFTTIALIRDINLDELCLSQDEVDEVFTIPLSKFKKDNLYVSSQHIYTELKDFPYEKYGIKEDYSWRIGDWDIPLYEVEGRKIWGLTARIIYDFMVTLHSQKLHYQK